MKYKDVLRNSLYLDEELQDYFNEMSKKGWRLDFVGYYYRFIKDEHVYKYQIDYTPISSEYQDILKEMGYHEVRNSFDDFRVLENENVDAPDLNTEFVFDKNNKMKQFKKIRYFIYPILAYFLFWLGKIFIKDIVEIGKPVLYYEGFGSLLMGIVFIVLSFVLLFVTILNFSILYALKNDKDLKSSRLSVGVLHGDLLAMGRKNSNKSGLLRVRQKYQPDILHQIAENTNLVFPLRFVFLKHGTKHSNTFQCRYS